MDFESTANELTKVSEKGLSSVSSLCKKQLELEDRVKALKAELKGNINRLIALCYAGI